jgi:hypothetical protein
LEHSKMIAVTLKAVRIQKALQKTANARLQKQADWLDDIGNAYNKAQGWAANKALPFAYNTVMRSIPGTPQYLDSLAQGAVAAHDVAKNVDWKKAGTEAAKLAINPAGYAGYNAGRLVGKGLGYVGGKIGDAVGSWWGNKTTAGKNAVIDRQLAKENRIAQQREAQRAQQPQQPQQPAYNPPNKQQLQQSQQVNGVQPGPAAAPVQEKLNQAQQSAAQRNYGKATAQVAQGGAKQVGQTVKQVTGGAADLVDYPGRAMENVSQNKSVQRVGTGLRAPGSIVRNVGNRVAGVANSNSWGEAGKNMANLVPGVASDAAKAVKNVGTVAGDVARNTIGDNAAGKATQSVMNLPGNVVDDVVSGGIGGFYNAVTGQGAENQGKDFGDRMKGFGQDMGNRFKKTFGLGLWN